MFAHCTGTEKRPESHGMNKRKPSETLPGARSVLLPIIFCGAMGLSQALSCLSPPTWHSPGILDASGRILHPMICAGWGREVLQRPRAVLELCCAKSTGEGGATGKIADKGAKEVSKKKKGKVSVEAGGDGGPGGPIASPLHISEDAAADRREMRGGRALAQWIAAEKKGRIKVLVAASELEFSLAQSLLLDDVVREDQVQQAFRSLDVDGSGTIDVAELKQGMRAVGAVPLTADLKRMMAAVDSDASGAIDLNEFRDVLTSRPHQVMDYFNMSTALQDRDATSSKVGITAVRIDLTLSGNDLLMDTLAVMQRVVAAHPGSLELILIKSRAVHQLAMRLHAAPRALLRGPAVLNDRPLQTPAILCAVGVTEYRQMIPLVVREGDSVLEIGCHSGTSTNMLFDAAGPSGHVVGVDIGPSIIGKARRDYGRVTFEVADGWDIATLGNLAVGSDGRASGSWDAIFVDIGGLSGPDGFLEAVSMLRQLTYAFPMARALVIKSACLRDFANRVFVCNEILRPLATYMQH